MINVSDSTALPLRKNGTVQATEEKGIDTFTEIWSPLTAVEASAAAPFTRIVIVAEPVGTPLSVRMSLTSWVILLLVRLGRMPVRQDLRAASFKVWRTSMAC